MTDKLRNDAHTPDPDPADIIAGALQTSRAHAYELMHKALAQQDAQVVQEPCAVVKWQTGGPVVHIIGDVQVGDLLYRAAPTPPAQRVYLTVEEIGEAALSAGCDPDCDDEALVVRLAHTVIEAYEKKNGINRG